MSTCTTRSMTMPKRGYYATFSGHGRPSRPKTCSSRMIQQRVAELQRKQQLVRGEGHVASGKRAYHQFRRTAVRERLRAHVMEGNPTSPVTTAYRSGP